MDQTIGMLVTALVGLLVAWVGLAIINKAKHKGILNYIGIAVVAVGLFGIALTMPVDGWVQFVALASCVIIIAVLIAMSAGFMPSLVGIILMVAAIYAAYRVLPGSTQDNLRQTWQSVADVVRQLGALFASAITTKK